MRQFRPSGSVREAVSDDRPYRDGMGPRMRPMCIPLCYYFLTYGYRTISSWGHSQDGFDCRLDCLTLFDEGTH